MQPVQDEQYLRKVGKNGQCTCDADCDTKGLRAMRGVKNDEGDKNDGD